MENQTILPLPPDGIRAWYKKNTRRAIRGLIGATVVLLMAVVLVWLFAPLDKLQHAQTFNGALTIPGFGGLWIASFMFIWLIPMREVSFRGQESMERMESKLQTTMDDHLIPAIQTWQRVGERLEKVILPKFESAIDSAERAAQLIEKKAVPAIDIARRIEANVEAELATGLLQELRSAAQSVNLLVMTKEGVPVPPDVDRALAALGNNGKTPRGGAR